MKRVQRKRRHHQTPSHIGWRANHDLKMRWYAFLKTQPPINRTEFLDAMLKHYLDLAERYGLDPISLRPRTRKS